VRLRDLEVFNEFIITIISIPSGAIKRNFIEIQIATKDGISIPSGAIKSLWTSPIDSNYGISIPSGAIKRT
jgi:hypothetical protein